MKLVEPEVRLIARTEIDWMGLKEYLDSVGAATGQGSWFYERFHGYSPSDAQALVEVGGKVCYRSWEPGLNPNVTRVRSDQEQYLENILSSGHGSVLEHAQFSFSLRHVSRVLTHELARHRAGTAISQESMRYVRLDDIPMWLPEWIDEYPVVKRQLMEFAEVSEKLQKNMAKYFKLDDEGVPFHEKKAKTSFMRRFAPTGVATDLIWSANVRALRHIIETRTAAGAEEEIRLVFGQVAEIMRKECPILFGDLRPNAKGEYVPEWSKV